MDDVTCYWNTLIKFKYIVEGISNKSYMCEHFDKKHKYPSIVDQCYKTIDKIYWVKNSFARWYIFP